MWSGNQGDQPLQAIDTPPPEKAKHAGGRPCEYTPEIAATICLRMAEGETLRAICRDSDTPARSTVYQWLSKNPEFADLYTQAREALVEHWADEILDISDDSTTDYITKIGRNGHEYEAVDQDHIQRSRLRVDSRKWLMSKLMPRKYGDHLEVEHTGDLQVTHVIDDRERMRRFALFLMEDEQAGALIEGTASAVQPDDEQAPPASQPVE